MNKNQVLNQEIRKIWNNKKKKKRKCIVEDCNNYAINSHILQKNGIINLICMDRHFYVLGLIDFLNPNSINDAPIQFQKTGINEGLSFPLYCNIHDTELFNNIEIGDYNPSLYKNQLLFAYRSVCNEMRKKEIQIDIQGSMLNNSIIRSESTDLKIEMITDLLNGYIMGLMDLKYYQKEFEVELFELEKTIPINKRFSFNTIYSNKLDICTSSIFSPIESETNLIQEEPLNTIFISIFPKEISTIVICGYHNKKSSKWISDFTHSWSKLTQKEIQKRISEILLTRCETWGISPNLYNSFNDKKKDDILNEILKFVFRYDQDMKSSINIFEN